MPDYDSEDIDGMDDDAGEEQVQNPPFTERWTTTPSYDVYMVDTPNENSDDDKEDPIEDNPTKIQSKHQRQCRPSKSRRGKDSNTSTGENNTPNDAKEEQSQPPLFTGRWTTTSTYDVYMVDTPKEDDGRW